MAWIPSHQQIGNHPKTLRLARKLNISVPAAVGHLHLLWHWALDHAPDGDVSRYDADDLAIGAMWEGDPAEFVAALIACGPGGSAGFLEVDLKLHDWSEHGGRYERRVAAAKKAATTRWNMQTQCEGNADALQTECVSDAQRNAEERREENTPTPPAPVRDVPDDDFDRFWQQYPRKLVRKEALKAWRQVTKSTDAEVIISGLGAWCSYWRRLKTQPQHIPHASTWLRQERWNEQPQGGPQQRPAQVAPSGVLMAPGVEY